MNDFWADIALWARPYLGYFLTPGGNQLFSLTAFTLIVTLFFLGRQWWIHRETRRNRQSLPLVIGGWGTRGKSGTERLKAALFTALGHHVVAKTTGSAAMFIRNVPGQPPAELTIFRPYDKATIWEQQRLLALAAKGHSHVFLWECMALNPHYVEILQGQWMRDDFSTITNAYPDHEDVQGPSGFDVATVISRFIPSQGTCFTSEIQMAPLLRERAGSRQTRLIEVSEREIHLLPRQILDRFPYEEHPANIALVLKLAEHLGLSREEALIEMADRVVPEIGMLKVYPEALLWGRRLRFINGMSANERAGFMNNWTRTGMEDLAPPKTEGHWTVTFVNNRGDRAARSQVFARILAEEIFTRRCVLAGTNLTGLRGFLTRSLRHHLARERLIDPGAYLESSADEIARAETRLSSWRRRLWIRPDAPAGVKAMLAQWPALEGVPAPEEAELTRLLDPHRHAAHSLSLVELEKSLASDPAFAALCREPDLPFLAEEAARHLVMDAVREELTSLRDVSSLVSARQIADLNDRLRRRLTELWLRGLVELNDPGIKGDAIVTAIARAVPEGFRATIMGMQNIKGPGLEMVYRWEAFEKAQKAGEDLLSPEPSRRLEALVRLQNLPDPGLLGALAARRCVQAAREEHRTDWDKTLLPTLEDLDRALSEETERRQNQVSRPSRFDPFGWARRKIEFLFDFLVSVWRARRADEVVSDLLAGRISQMRAALLLRELSQMQKGGWLSLLFGRRKHP